MFPPIAIVTLHWVISNILIGHQPSEHLHLLLLWQSKETLSLRQSTLCILLINTLKEMSDKLSSTVLAKTHMVD